LIDGYVSVYSKVLPKPQAKPIPAAMTGAAFRARFSKPRIGKDEITDRDWYDTLADPSPVDIGGVFTEMYRYLLRVARLAKAVGLDQDGLDLLVARAASFPVQLAVFRNQFGTAFPALPVAAGMLFLLARAIAQAKALDLTQPVYFAKAADAQIGSDSDFAAWLAGAMGKASVLTALTDQELAALAAQARKFDAGLFLPSFLARMLALLHLAADLGLPIDQVVALVWAAPPSAINRLTQAQADALRAVLRQQAGDGAAWARIIQPIQDRLRINLRDALVAYYLAHETYRDDEGQTRRYDDEATLFRRFLIDPEMAPCMLTSRIVLAISSAQFLIRRGLLGLEPGVCLDDRDKQEWEWRKNYRLFEAARKVFLYPENWIDPSLRLEKSPFFAEAQDQLLQDELNDPNVEKVFNGYLSKLLDVSRLDIRGLYVEDVGTDRTFHVFGRTWNPPYRYYYRRRDPDRRWSPWEALEFDIDGDHIIPVIFNRRLYLFWPLFVEKEHKTIKDPFDPERKRGAPYLEIRMCYAKREFGKWTAKKQLDGTLIAGNYAGPAAYGNTLVKLTYTQPNVVHVPLDPDTFFFWASLDAASGDLSINVLRWYDLAYSTYLVVLGRDGPHPPFVAAYSSYSNMVAEDGYLISACDERLTLVSPSTPAGTKPGTNFQHQYVGRPYPTIPKAMQLAEWSEMLSSPPVRGVYVRVGGASFVGDAGNTRILGNAHFPYTLTYPHQYQHALATQPFFLSDRRHTHFVQTVALGHEISPSWIITFLAHSVQLHEHPYCCLMLRELHRLGVDGLLAPKGDSQESNQLRRQQVTETYFPADYAPNNQILPPYPVKSFEFGYYGAYSIYNWETFFHLPALIGRQLRLDQKHAEAIRWLSFIFDPTNRETALGTRRFWMLKPFYDRVSPTSIQTLMRLLAGTGLSPAEEEQRKEFAAQIDRWRKHQFEPHAVAEMRIEAYMRWTVMEYIETLIDWGDKLFRRDTRESLNEAMQLYMMAAEILGPRPRKVEGAKPPERSYADLAADLDQFSNAVVGVENSRIGVTAQTYYNGDPPRPNPTPVSLYFCIPENPQLMEYWNRVEDRLFKIRHCRNIDGQQRELALFAPPIDPALLVKARAAGLDLSDVLDSLFAPNPRHRFSYLLARAADFCNEVKSLGGQLLSALEKRDAEGLAELRQVHEQNILRASRNIKKMQVEEAKQSLAAAEHGRNLAQIRLTDYTSREFMIAEETSAKGLTEEAHTLQLAEQRMMLLSSMLAPIAFSVGTSGLGPHWTLNVDLGLVPRIVGQAIGAHASALLNTANRVLTSASYTRRKEDWNLQIKQAAEEIQQAEKQIAAAEIRLAIAEKDLENHDLQMEQSSAMLDWMRDKFTNDKLYSWMSGALKTLHRKAYQLAFDLAKQAQKAFELELGRTEQYVEYGHWDSARQGLLAGDRLSIQLKELEAAYMRNNTREFELTRSISLRLLDPVALMRLRSGGAPTFELPEWLFQMDFPDMELYAMRLKSVAVSLPCVTGPYTPTNVRLRLASHKLGWSPGSSTAADWLPVDMANEIITSSAVNDPALFEANLRDERYLPFENAGVVSKWEVALPASPAFDYQTISDLVLHIRYVAKGNSIVSNPPAAFQPGQVLLSLRQDFSDFWRQLRFNLDGTADGAAFPPVVLPLADIGMVPYRLRQGTASFPLTASSIWVLHRTSSGPFKLSNAIQAAPLSIAIGPEPNRSLHYDPSATPYLVYKDDPSNSLPIVEDILVLYDVT
jgi:receptor-binding and translocation channel-forming TcA subunit of Tc toxin/ABC toxin-like protein/neuraminidase-like protein